MPNNTNELNLYEYDPATDSELTFNIDEALNDNWIKIDDAVKDLRNRVRGVIADLTTLKAVNTTSINNGALVLVEQLGLYRLDKASAAVADDDTIIQPTTGAGRWIKIAEVSVSHTVVDTQAPTGDKAKWPTLFNWIANMIKSITGESNWRTPASRSIRQLIIPYATTTNVGNTYSANFSPALTVLTDGQAVVIKINADQTAAATLKPNSLADIPLKKANGNDMLSMKAGGIYSYRYNATTGNFILQGEGGEYGTARQAQVLQGYTVGTDTGLIEGSIVDNGSVGTQILSTEGQEYTIPVGNHNGLGKVKATITGLVPEVIKRNSVVGGITGTYDAIGLKYYGQPTLTTNSIPTKAVKIGTEIFYNQADSYLIFRAYDINTKSSTSISHPFVSNETIEFMTTWGKYVVVGTVYRPSYANAKSRLYFFDTVARSWTLKNSKSPMISDASGFSSAVAVVDPNTNILYAGMGGQWQLDSGGSLTAGGWEALSGIQLSESDMTSTTWTRYLSGSISGMSNCLGGAYIKNSKVYFYHVYGGNINRVGYYDIVANTYSLIYTGPANQRGSMWVQTGTKIMILSTEQYQDLDGTSTLYRVGDEASVILDMSGNKTSNLGISPLGVYSGFIFRDSTNDDEYYLFRTEISVKTNTSTFTSQRNTGLYRISIS